MGRKRQRAQKQKDLGIPKVLTANLGNSLREEMASSPEVFETVNVKENSKEGGSTGIENTSLKASEPKRKSLNKRKTKRKVQITKKERIENYDADSLRNLTESSGTHSYDSPRSNTSMHRYIERADLVTPELINFIKAEFINSTPNVNAILPDFETYSQPAFTNLLRAEKPPEYGEFEPIPAKGIYALEQQNFVKEMVSNALAEFFVAPSDDLLLTIRVKRKGVQPILNLKLEKDASSKKKPANNNESGSQGCFHTSTLVDATQKGRLCCAHRRHSINRTTGDKDMPAVTGQMDFVINQLSILGNRTYNILKGICFWNK